MGKRDDRPNEETHLSPQVRVATWVLRYKGFQLALDLYVGTEQEGPCEDSQQSPQLWVGPSFNVQLTFNFWMLTLRQGLRVRSGESPFPSAPGAQPRVEE